MRSLDDERHPGDLGDRCREEARVEQVRVQDIHVALVKGACKREGRAAMVWLAQAQRDQRHVVGHVEPDPRRDLRRANE